MDAADAAAKVTPRTVGVIPVHLSGQPVDLPAARELASKFGLWMLEDCAQAHGAAWQGQKVGAFGGAAVFSFYPSKTLTVMGDGGAIAPDDEEIAARGRRLRDQGRLNKDVHSEVGFTLPFNDIQAAIGRVLLRRLDAMNDRRRELAARYGTGLAGLPLELPRERPGARHVYHLYVVRTPRRAELAAFLKDRGIQTGVHYPVPTHRQPAVEHFAPSPLPATERLVDEILTLPISPGHTDAEIDAAANAVGARALPFLEGFRGGRTWPALTGGVSFPAAGAGRAGSTTGRVQAIVAVGESIKRGLVAGGVPAGKIEVIYSGTDLERFHPGVDGGPIRRELGLGRDDRLVTQVGVRSWRGWRELIAAMRKVAARQPRARLLFVRAPPPRLGEIADRARAAGLGDRVTALGHRDDVPAILCASDVVADASWAGLGITGSIREALACERPVVATAVEGMPELVRPGETGLLVPP